MDQPTDRMIIAGATAILNSRSARRGKPYDSGALENAPYDLREAVKDEAAAAITAAFAVAPWAEVKINPSA